MAIEGCSRCKYEKIAVGDEPCRDCLLLNEDGDRSFFTEKRTHSEEKVEHPEHYNRAGAMECIDEMVAVFGREAVMNFCLCRVWEYRYRAADKNGEEDLKNSDFYMSKYLELRGKE